MFIETWWYNSSLTQSVWLNINRNNSKDCKIFQHPIAYDRAGKLRFLVWTEVCTVVCIFMVIIRNPPHITKSSDWNIIVTMNCTISLIFILNTNMQFWTILIHWLLFENITFNNSTNPCLKTYLKPWSHEELIDLEMSLYCCCKTQSLRIARASEWLAQTIPRRRCPDKPRSPYLLSLQLKPLLHANNMIQIKKFKLLICIWIIFKNRTLSMIFNAYRLHFRHRAVNLRNHISQKPTDE